MYNNRVKSIELPENLFSNLGELKSKKIEFKPKSIEDTKKTSVFENEPKLTNYSQKKEYRNRISKMYEDMKDIDPIDNEIDSLLYFNNYVEKGIVIKPKIASLKQFWTEYRLINNEKTNTKKTSTTENKELSNFDELFETLSIRVKEINRYIDELKEMRANINVSSKKLEEEKEKLSAEKEDFNNYKTQEENKLREEKQNLKINYDRLQTIIDDLDKKLEDIDQ